jgi:hypothetical protein
MGHPSEPTTPLSPTRALGFGSRSFLLSAVRSSRRMAVVACALFVLIPPLVAYAGTWFNYAQGTNDSNPTECYHSDSYAKSKCSNGDDNSGVTWTCQTTKP